MAQPMAPAAGASATSGRWRSTGRCSAVPFRSLATTRHHVGNGTADPRLVLQHDPRERRHAQRALWRLSTPPTTPASRSVTTSPSLSSVPPTTIYTSWRWVSETLRARRQIADSRRAAHRSGASLCTLARCAVRCDDRRAAVAQVTGGRGVSQNVRLGEYTTE